MNKNISSPLHIIVLSEDKKDEFLSKLNIALRLIFESLFYLTETKIALILNRYQNSTDLIQKIFSIANTGNLINFVILECAARESIRVINHDFFHDTTAVAKYKTNAIIKYFPNKFDKIRGYIMRTGVSKHGWPDFYKNYTLNYSYYRNMYSLISRLKSFD